MNSSSTRAPGTVRLGSWSAPLGSAVQYLLRPGARQQNDASTARELNVASMKQSLPDGLALRWLGTAGFVLSYEGYDLVIDPFLTRTPLGDLVKRRVLHPDEEVIARYVPKADAILVGHTHYDHALDVPTLARLNRCKVYGSSSLAQLMAMSGQREAAEPVETGRVYALGPFEVTFVESMHSKLVLGMKVNGEGEITCDHLDGMHEGEYRCGQMYGIHIAVAGKTFYHQGSANLIEERLLHDRVDYLLCGIAGRGFTRDFTSRVLRALSPETVIAHHLDNFFLPLKPIESSEPGESMGFSFNVNFGGFVDEVRAVSSDFDVCVFDPLQGVTGSNVSVSR